MAAKTDDGILLHQSTSMMESSNHLLHAWTEVPQSLLPQMPIHVLIEAQALASPNATAFETTDTCVWSRSQLWRVVMVVVHRLSNQGLAKDTCIAIGIDEGPAMVILEIAVLVIGCFFLPLDLQFPASLHAEDSQCESIACPRRMGRRATGGRATRFCPADHTIWRLYTRRATIKCARGKFQRYEKGMAQTLLQW